MSKELSIAKLAIDLDTEQVEIEAPTYESDKSRYKVGEQILISLIGFGDFTATAQKCVKGRTLFIFDDCVSREKVNRYNMNKGGFDNSDLNRWLQEILFPAFPQEMKEKTIDLTIPTYGQIFGHDGWSNKIFELDNDEQLPLMKKRKNRIADYNNEYGYYWLKNAVKRPISVSSFAAVHIDGHAYYAVASSYIGVRPAFWLID